MRKSANDSTRSNELRGWTSQGSVSEVFLAALRLGLTSFGGPIAHLGYFRNEYVVRRRWLDDQAYSELVGLCQFLPGPASSQVGYAIGWLRAGALGALAAWVAFTLPSALLMFAFALASQSFHGPKADAVVHGLKVAAVAVVAQALVGMVRTLTPDLRRIAMAAISAATMLLIAKPAVQVLFIAGGAVAGLIVCPVKPSELRGQFGHAPTRQAGVSAFVVFIAILIALPLLGDAGDFFGLASVFYRSGALVFGGGHVVLPLLREGLVPHWMNDTSFLAGYGAAQALPGPLFSIASYLGAVSVPALAPWASALAVLAIFLPGLLLVTGSLAFQRSIMGNVRARRAMAGVNAAVVGILAAALYDPLWTTGIATLVDVIVAAGAFFLLLRFKTPPILVVALCVGVNAGLAL